jgi:hypothetical protein
LLATLLQLGDLARKYVQALHIIACSGQTCASEQTDMAGADYSDIHSVHFLFKEDTSKNWAIPGFLGRQVVNHWHSFVFVQNPK